VWSELFYLNFWTTIWLIYAELTNSNNIQIWYILYRY
jgi:hypothetical protein